MPSDGTWLECNGQSTVSYPELASIIGATVPDYRGVFLRGHGSTLSTHYGTVTHSSGNLNELQGDAIRNIWGSVIYAGTSALYNATGAFYVAGTNWGYYHQSDGTNYGYASFDSSRIVPTSNENRPINKAVKYLIKAK